MIWHKRDVAKRILDTAGHGYAIGSHQYDSALTAYFSIDEGFADGN